MGKKINSIAARFTSTGKISLVTVTVEINVQNKQSQQEQAEGISFYYYSKEGTLILAEISRCTGGRIKTVIAPNGIYQNRQIPAAMRHNI